METFEEHQVFISFRGMDLRNTFVTHLVKYLESNNINVFIDNHEDKGQPLEVLLKRIEESKIALVIFSEHYTESKWCLNELDKIKDCSDEGALKVIPIFYQLNVSTVKNLEGKLGDVFRSLTESDERKNKWKEAIKSITNVMGITIDNKSDESEVCLKIVEVIKNVLNTIPLERSQNATVDDPAGNSNVGAS